MGTQPVRGVPDELPLPAPVTLGWDAGDVFSPGAVAHDQLKLLARDSVCPGRPSAQRGIVFGISGAVCGVRDVATALECLPGLHPALGHVSLFQGDWRLPAILQQWAAHMAVYQVSGGHSVQVYSGGGGVTHPPGAEGSVTWVPRSTYSRGRVVFKAASSSSTAYVAANIDARALGRYLRRSTALELPTKVRQAVLRRLEHAAGPTGRGTLDTLSGGTASDHRGLGDLRAVTLNLRRGLMGKMPALGSCLRGWGYPDLVGLQEVGKMPANMVVHAMYWATFTPAAHPAAGVGLLVRWHPTFREVWRDMHSSGRGVALEYHCRGGHILAVVVYFPADQDLDVVRSILSWALGVMAPRRGVYTLMMGDFNANPGWATGFRQAPAALTILWEEFVQDTGLVRCHPTSEAPTWTDGRGCVGVIDHMLQGPAPKEGHLWVDEASPFPSDHRPVVWDARDCQGPEDRPPVRLRARHFQIRDPGITGSYHAALSAARREEGLRPASLTALYESFLASTIRAVERARGPPREFGELPGRVDQVHRQLQAHAKRCPRWWESLDTLKERLDLRQDLAEAWEVGNLQRYLSHLAEVAPFARPSRGAFRHLYGPARTPPVQPRFCAQVDVAPRGRAKVALDQVRHRHQKTPRELTPGDVRALTGWVTPTQPLGLPTATVPHLRRILQRTGNTAPARDQLQYWMLREMDDDGLAIVCEVVNRYMRGERLEALSHGDLHLLPKKPPHGVGSNDRPLTNLVLLRKVVGLVVKEEEQPWLREHGFLPPSQFALWPGTSIWDFLRVLHNYFWYRWGSGGEAWPVLDDVRHAFGSPDHVSRDSVHQVVGYGPELCHLHRSLVEDMRLDMGGTDDVDHAEGWFDAGSGQGCPLSPLDYAPMGEVRAKMVSRNYPGVLTPAGLLHSLAWADDTVWLGGSPEDVSAIAKALPAAEDAVALGSDVSKMHVLRTWMDGQRVRYGVPSVLMNGVRLPVPTEKDYIRSLGRHALPHTYHKEDFHDGGAACFRGYPHQVLAGAIPPSHVQPEGGRHGAFPGRGPAPPGPGMAPRGLPRHLRPPGDCGGKPASAPPAWACAGGAFRHSPSGSGRVDHVCAQLHPSAEPPQSSDPGFRPVGAHVRPLAVPPGHALRTPGPGGL